MKTLLRRITNLNPKPSPSIPNNLPHFPHHITTTPQSPQTTSSEQELEKTAAEITTICKSFPNTLNWKTLNKNLTLFNLTNPSLINKVIIHLKDPPNAQKALSFFHWSSHYTNTTHPIHTYTLLIHVLVNAKLIKDATALIESVLSRPKTESWVESFMASYEVIGANTFVFDLFVQICSKRRMVDEAIDVCVCVGENGFRLNVISYNVLLRVVGKSDRVKLVWRVYEVMMVYRTYPNEKSVEIMVEALCKEGRLQKFVDVVDRIDGKRCLPKGIVSTCLVFGMIEEGRVEDGLVLLKRMLMKNMIVDTVSCSLIVYAKIKKGELESAWKVYDEMVKTGFKANSFLHTSFIGAYCDAGKIEDGEELFSDMERLGLQAYDETYTHMIVGCSKGGKLEESLSYCEKMVRNGFVPSCLAFNEMAERINGHENVRRADEMLTVLLDKGFIPNANTYSYLIAGYGREGDIEGVLKLYYEMEYRKLSPDASVFTWLIVGLYQAGRCEESENYMRTMKARSLVPLDYTYNALISSHVMDKDNKTDQNQSCS